MKKYIFEIIFISIIILLNTACKKAPIPYLNGPTSQQITTDATISELNNLVTGTESGLRNNIAIYLDVVSMIGREGYRFSGSEPRYTSDLLGAGSAILDNNTFYLTNPWGSRYNTIRNAYILIQAATNSSYLTNAQKKAYTGWAKTIIAYQLLLNLNLTYENGIRVDVADYNKLGPIVGLSNALTAISNLLNQGQTDLTGSDVIFKLSSGFSGFTTVAGLVQFNRALAARVDVYQQNWTAALTDLNASFFNLNGSFNTGIYHVFSTASGDQLNPLYLPLNNTGENRLAQPSYVADIEPGDDRINKVALRSAPATQSGLTSNYDLAIFKTNTDPVAIIRNEELILIYAEAKIQTNALADALIAINIIRIGHNLPIYSGPLTRSALITEMLKQRRYSLFYEGYRWVDVRRYNLLSTLPLDRPTDHIWKQFPLPFSEK
ncbi:RagB/SusD family nutrient uptake outer membrane protein [Hydrotalea sp.]|uniref:RagB/SusD family nutrient uptake outer membrane protein n=1 Tax=Hydrotalea sp. TaxID=2881279 RepID=UPI00262C33F2|nr:RagB/SusD family nutrient uptake outer membrane protein [Hydrotalea sp.]